MNGGCAVSEGSQVCEFPCTPATLLGHYLKLVGSEHHAFPSYSTNVTVLVMALAQEGFRFDGSECCIVWKLCKLHQQA